MYGDALKCFSRNTSKLGAGQGIAASISGKVLRCGMTGSVSSRTHFPTLRPQDGLYGGLFQEIYKGADVTDMWCFSRNTTYPSRRAVHSGAYSRKSIKVRM